tara:strand:- start:4647 stop:5450 length:804 start_codon:yes stop_codon:yes gene_type:complete
MEFIKGDCKVMKRYLLGAGLVLSFLIAPQYAYAEKLKGIGIMYLPGSLKKLPEITETKAYIENKRKNNLAVDLSLFSEEPFFKKQKFLKLEPAMSLSERIDRLLYGIFTDIPPEYDHYGYEIRRYMAAIGSLEAYRNEESVAREIKNIKTAQIILDYWEKSLKKEIDEIDAILKENRDTTSLRTRYRYNRGIVTAFMVEMNSWLEHNLNLLEYVQELGGRRFQISDKTKILSLRNEDELKRYAKLYRVKLEALAEVRGYMPFRMMIY